VREALWIGLGGFAGALARYWLASAIGARVPTPLPLGTLVTNLTGSFLLGLLVGLLESRVVSPVFRLALATGFLGAYTTFSTFTFGTIRLLEEGQPAPREPQRRRQRGAGTRRGPRGIAARAAAVSAVTRRRNDHAR
jgi:CrcB protein